MTVISETAIDHTSAAGSQASYRQIRTSASKVGRFTLHLLEMLLAMMPGMLLFSFLGDLIPKTSSYSAAFEYGTNLFDLGMVIFMSVPMVAWMVVRGHGRRHGAEMAFGMGAPVVAIVVLRLLGADAYLPWLADLSHPATFIGMIIMMLYRRDHFTAKAGHSAHGTH